MEKKQLDWSNLGFGYIKTDKRYVANFKDGKWDEGGLTEDDMILMSECAGVLQYAQTVFEGMKAYTTEDGHIVTFRPDMNAKRTNNTNKRLCIPEIPEERHPTGRGDRGLPQKHHPPCQQRVEKPEHQYERGTPHGNHAGDPCAHARLRRDRSRR